MHIDPPTFLIPMIADASNSNGNGELDVDVFDVYSEVDPSLGKISNRLRSASPSQRYDSIAEIGLLVQSILKLVTLRKGAVDKGDHDLALQLDEAIFDKAQKVVRAKEVGAKISSLMTNSWTTDTVRHFMLRVIGYVSIVVPDVSEEQLRLLTTFINRHIELEVVKGSSYTPDQDLRLMDETIPRS